MKIQLTYISNILFIILCLLTKTCFSVSNPVVAIYGSNPIYSGNNPNIQRNINELKASGFNTIIFWSVHVNEDGDLIYNDETIVKDGVYIGDPNWSSYIAQLKTGTTSVKRIFFSVGSCCVVDYQNIHDLLESQGRGPDSILYRNFKALRDEIGIINGIDLDNEDLFDHDTIVEFSLLLGDLGFKVSFCVYNVDKLLFWLDCLHDVNDQVPGLVSEIYLQCYAGGDPGDPITWKLPIVIFNLNTPVYPGLWSIHDNGVGDQPSDVQARFSFWRLENIKGGFMWFYDDMLKNGPPAAQYASAIKKGLGAS